MYGVKKERILRVLLNKPDGSLTKYRVAKFAECSIGWTIEYLQNLEMTGYIKRTKVVKQKALLEHWASFSQRPAHYDFFLPSPTEFLRNIRMDYVLTTYLAENLINHYLFPVRADTYIKKEDFQMWKDQIAKKGQVGKGNLRLLIHDPHVFYGRHKIGGLWVASLPQVLVDLKKEGGVCEEAYDLLVRKYVRAK